MKATCKDEEGQTNQVEEHQRLLVVDDNRAIHEDIHKIFDTSPGAAMLDRLEAALFEEDAPTNSTHATFAIDSGYQGEQALELVKKACSEGLPYSVGVVDMRMPPGWDGIETIKQLWNVDPNLQVIICSAYSDHSWSDIVGELGLCDRLLVLKKPFDNVELIQMVYALSEKWRLHKESQQRFEQLDSLVRQRTLSLEEVNDRLNRELAERDRMEVELRLAQKLEAVGQLASGIAHEINTPIQYVGDNVHFLKTAFEDLNSLRLTYQQGLREFSKEPRYETLQAEIEQAEALADLSYLKEQVPKALDRSLVGVERVAGIVRAMKDFAHPDQGEKHPADINQAIHNTLTVARNEYKYVAEVVTDLNDLPPVTCHIGELSQVFLNLIVNAAHAIGEKVDGERGKILISTESAGDQVVISIEDNGAGIPGEIQDRVFEPFFTTKEVGKGTGQGLAISRSIVIDKHGGSLTFESQESHGTRFEIRVPVDGGSTEEVAA